MRCNTNTTKGETMNYETDEQFYSRPENKRYLLIDEDGDIYAEIRFPSSFSESNVEHALEAMVWATSTKWIEA
jgi:hypothetical protein